MSNAIEIVKEAVYRLYKVEKKGGYRGLARDLYGDDNKHSSIAEAYKEDKKNISKENLAKIERDIITFAIKNEDLFQTDDKIRSALKELEMVARLANFETKKSKYQEWLEMKAQEKLKEARESDDLEAGLGVGAAALMVGGVAALFAGPIGLGIGALLGGVSVAAGAVAKNSKTSSSADAFKKSQELQEKISRKMSDYKKSLDESLKIIIEENLKNQLEINKIMQELENEVANIGLPKQYEKEAIQEFRHFQQQIPTLANIFLIPSSEGTQDNELKKMVEEVFEVILNKKSKL
jgi:hypothetical protein